jgi:hypothetical protein
MMMETLFPSPPIKPRPAPRLRSVIEGRDPDVLNALFGFYRRPANGLIIDVTCNARRTWQGLDATGVVFCDVDPAMRAEIICDYRRMPFAEDSASVIVFDPPHLPAAAGSAKSHEQYKRDYGLSRSARADNISEYFYAFLLEARRALVPDGLVFAKLTDFVHNHRYQWTLLDFVSYIGAVEGLTATDLIIKRDPCAGNLKSSKWVAAHHARRAHCWWVVVRKGKCEPSGDYGEPGPVGRFVRDPVVEVMS